MKSTIKEWLNDCVEKLNAGELTEADLRGVTTVLNPEKQLLLYLYSKSTNLRSPLGGMGTLRRNRTGRTRTTVTGTTVRVRT